VSISSIKKYIDSEKEGEEQWIALSDAMAGLMMLFMLIAILFMHRVESDIINVAAKIKQLENELHKELDEEFKEDFKKWIAIINRLTVRFKEPTLLFEPGKDILKNEFKIILNNFIPRYIKIINAEKYREVISEIRIEGHTSTDYKNLSLEAAYIENMILSQNRAKSTLIHILRDIKGINHRKDWMRKYISSIGMSSSRFIKKQDGREDRDQSRRVEFRILLKTDEAVSKMKEL